MIGLLWICQPGWEEIRNTLLAINSLSPLVACNKDLGAASQMLLTEVKLSLQWRLMFNSKKHIYMSFFSIHNMCREPSFWKADRAKKNLPWWPFMEGSGWKCWHKLWAWWSVCTYRGGRPQLVVGRPGFRQRASLWDSHSQQVLALWKNKTKK